MLPKIRHNLVPVILVAAALGALASVASATRDVHDLMTMDHHLVQSDFIGVVRVERIAFTPNQTPVRRISAVVEDVWSSRWDVASGDELPITTVPQIDLFAHGQRYVVLLAGGPWHGSPLTHRNNSVFHIRGETLACSNGLALYGALSDGFLCSVPELVVGEPVALSELRRQVVTLRTRAASRLAALEESLSRGLRPLRAAPVAAHAHEDIRR